MSEETDLKGHSKDGKRLHPPFNAKLGGLKLTSWKDQAMPEILWAVLVRGNLPRETALVFFQHVAGFVQQNPEYADVRLSEIGKLSPEKRKTLIVHLARWSPEVKKLLQSLLVFPNLPGRTEWAEVLGEPDWDTAGTDLATSVKEVLWHQSEPATDCRWVSFLCYLQSGKMQISSSIENAQDLVRGVYEYPHFGDVARVQGFIRSADLRIGIEEQDMTWVNHFWDECLKNTSCIPESPDPEFPYSQEEWDRRQEHYREETAKVRKALISHYLETASTTAIDPRFEAAFGLTLYSQSLLDEVALYRLNFSIIGRLALRAMVETYITLAYLVSKDDPGIWAAYREYGTGQAKLAHLKLKELGTTPAAINAAKIERIANEDRWQEFVSINIGHWDESNLRKHADEAGVKELYDKYYVWTSGYMHGNWAAVRETMFQSCFNPLHRLHRIPDFGLPILEEAIDDGVEIGNKTLDLLDGLYPAFKERVNIAPIAPTGS